METRLTLYQASIWAGWSLSASGLPVGPMVIASGAEGGGLHLSGAQGVPNIVAIRTPVDPMSSIRCFLVTAGATQQRDKGNLARKCN
jgi:hypothetical protein